VEDGGGRDGPRRGARSGHAQADAGVPGERLRLHQSPGRKDGLRGACARGRDRQEAHGLRRQVLAEQSAYARAAFRENAGGLAPRLRRTRGARKPAGHGHGGRDRQRCAHAPVAARRSAWFASVVAAPGRRAGGIRRHSTGVAAAHVADGNQVRPGMAGERLSGFRARHRLALLQCRPARPALGGASGVACRCVLRDLEHASRHPGSARQLAGLAAALLREPTQGWSRTARDPIAPDHRLVLSAPRPRGADLARRVSDRRRRCGRCPDHHGSARVARCTPAAESL
jgi:hypothetical protein